MLRFEDRWDASTELLKGKPAAGNTAATNNARNQRESHDWFNKLPPEPKKSVISYTGVGYSDINRSNAARRAIIYTYNPARLGRINEQRFLPLVQPPEIGR